MQGSLETLHVALFKLEMTDAKLCGKEYGTYENTIGKKGMSP